MGRKRTHDRGKVMATVCERISQGETVEQVCAEIGVASRTVREWALEDAFAPLYARAREAQAHAVAEQALTVAASAYGKSSEDIAATRLEVDTRKWFAAKLAPKHYGERQAVEHTGAGGTPLRFTFAIGEPAQDDE